MCRRFDPMFTALWGGEAEGDGKQKITILSDMPIIIITSGTRVSVDTRNGDIFKINN